MAGTIVRLEWERDSKGYRLEQRTATRGRTIVEGKSGGMFIVPRGGRLESYRLEGIGTRLFEELAGTPCKEHAALKFVERWGLLYRGKDVSVWLSDGPHGIVDGEMFRSIRQLQAAIRLAADGSGPGRLERAMNKHAVGLLDVRFGRMKGDSTPRVYIEPKTLLAFAWVEFMQTIAGGAVFQSCANCGAFFSTGAGGGRRSTRVYCSDGCRVAMYRRNLRDS